jgi:hypothetical protein
MASNKTKLAEASNKSAFDFDDDFGSFDDDPITGSKKSPVQQFMAGFKDGIIDPSKNKSLLKAFLTNGAPKGYDRLFGMYDQAKQSAGSLKDHLEKTNPGDLQYLFKRAESFLPSMKGKMSETTYDRINTALSNKAEQYKYQIEANQDQGRLAIRKQKVEDESTIKQGLGDDLRSAVDQGTVVQRSLFNMGQEADQRRWDLERIERGLRDQVDNKYQQNVARGLAQAVDALTRTSSYMEQVDYDFKRKGLELQFRSYQALRDISKMTEASLQMQNKAFQALVRNTGLPDHLKSSMKDLVGMNMRQGMASAGSSMVGKTLSGFLGNYGSNVQNRVNQKASGALSGIVQGLQAGDSMSGMWDQRYNLAGNLAADGVHSLARNTVAPILGRMARPAMTRLSNKHGKGKHNQVGYMADNMPAMMQEFVNNYQNGHGAKGVLQDMLRPFTPQFGLDTATKSGSYQTIGQHTAFNQLSQRSLTEILPGFQARILRELRMIRSGKDDVPLEVFDITKGIFTTSKNAKEAIKDRIVSKGTTKMVSGQISETLDHIDKDGKLSTGARKALSERLLRDASSNKRFDPMKYGSKYGYKEGTSKDTLKELEEFFKGQFERDEKGKFADTAANHEKRKGMSDKFLDIRNVSRDPAQEIHRLIEAGDTGQLRELGIVTTEQGVDRINYPMLWQMMSSDVSMKHAGAGANYHDAAGDSSDKNFVGPQFPGAFSARAQNGAIKFMDKNGQRMKDGAKRLGGGARDLMDQFKSDPMQFMRDQYNQGSTAVKGRVDNLRSSGAAAMDAAKAGGLPAIMEHFSAQEKLDFAKALLNNVIDKEPPAMKEARLQMAQAIINSISSGKEAGQKMLASETGQKAIAAGNNVLAIGNDKMTQIKQSEAMGVVDLKLEGANDTLIKAIDIMQGKLIDVNTGKIIQKASDITGEVRNHLNQQVASAEEVARGLFDNRGQLMAQAKSKLDAVQKVIAAHAQKGVDTAKAKMDDMKDWCLEGSDKVIIKARDLLEGNIIDEETGEPIYSLDDIKGNITDQYGLLIATAQELGRGLRSTDNTKFDMASVKGKAAKMASQLWRGNTTQNIFAGMKMAGKVAWMLARNTAARIMGDRDAYLPGKTKPVLTVEKLKEGQYLDQDQKVITSFSDINGPVFDAESGEPILDKDELKLLVESTGKKHKIAKNRGLMRRVFKATVGKAAKGYWNMTKKYYGALGREMGNDAHALAKTVLAPIGSFSKRQLANLSTTDQVLVQIRDAIRETVPKKNRKGSWMDKNEQRSAEDKNKDNKEDKEQKESKGLFGKMAGALSGLWAKMTGKKKEEGEEEEGGIMDTAGDVVDGVSTAGDVLDTAKGAKGKLGKWGKKLAGSKAGKFVGKIAGSAAGRIAASAGGQMAMRGAAMVGTALAGLISAPVLIGAAVVAGVGIAGYFTYKYFAGVKGEFMSVRMLQYGITSTRQRHKVLELEKLFEKSAMRGAEPKLNVRGSDGEAIMDIMGFSKDNEAEIHRFARWVDLRMKPVFVTWLKALNTVGKMEISLTDIEDKLDDKLKGTLVKEITLPYGDGSPFAMRDNPFGDSEPLDDTTEETQERIKDLTEKYKVDASKEGEKDKLPGEKPKDTEEAKSNKEGAAVVGATAAAAAKVAVDEAKAIGKASNEGKAEAAKSVSQRVNEMAKVAGVGAAAGGAMLLVGPVPIAGSELAALDSIRARAYGMETLNKNQMEALIAMETRVDLQSKTDQSGQVKFNGDMEKFITGAGGLFGMNTADHGPDRVKFVNWFMDRFLPVCETFLTRARATFKGKPSNAATGIKLGDQVSVANAIMGAVSPNGTSVWSSPSIFEVKGKLEDLKGLADIDMAYLQKQADAVMASPTQSAGAQAQGAQEAAGGKSFLGSIGDKIGSAFQGAKDALTGAVVGTGKALGGAVSTLREWKQSAAREISAVAVNAYGAASEAVTGQSYGYVSGGNGGSWEQVPMPTSKDAKGARKSMEAVAAMTGVPVEYLMIFCAMESNFDWTAKAGAGGSATGWFQFINSTWDWMVSLNGAKYGFPADMGRRLRLDPRMNALMGAEYMKYSMGVIKKGTGKDPSDIDLYIAHFMGPGTAVKWINMDKSTIGSSAFPKEAAANPSVFKEKGGQPRTLGQIEKSFDDRMAKYRAIATAGTAGGAAVPLKVEDVEKQAAEAKAKEMEAAAKKDEKFIPGVSAMPGGPSATGSTPTNTGTGGPTAPAAASAATQAPAGASTVPVGVMAPTAAPAPESAPAEVNPGAQAAQAASLAKDQQRAQQVQQSTQNDTAIMSVQQQQLDTQKQMLEVLKQLASNQGAGAQGNSMPKQQTRAANKAPWPVNV